MSENQRDKVIKKMHHKFQKLVKNYSSANVYAVSCYYNFEGFPEADRRQIYDLLNLPELKEGEWFCPAVFNGIKHEILMFNPQKIPAEEIQDYYEAMSNAQNPHDYDFNWGINGSALKRITKVYQEAEKVWVGKSDSTGMKVLDSYLSSLSALKKIERIQVEKDTEESHIPTLSDEELSEVLEGLSDFDDLPEEKNPYTPRLVKAGAPKDLISLNNLLHRMWWKIGGNHKKQDPLLLEALEIAFEAGSNWAKFHHPPESIIAAKKGLAFLDTQGQIKQSEFKIAVLKIRNSGTTKPDDIVDKLVDMKIIKSVGAGYIVLYEGENIINKDSLKKKIKRVK